MARQGSGHDAEQLEAASPPRPDRRGQPGGIGRSLLKLGLALSLMIVGAAVAVGLLVAGASLLGRALTMVIDLDGADATSAVLLALLCVSLFGVWFYLTGQLTTLAEHLDRSDHVWEEDEEEENGVELDDKGLDELRQAMLASMPKINDPCYCGSGKKYRYCHGR